MRPILFSLGPVTVYSFGLCLAGAFLTVAFVVWREARRRGLAEEKVLDAFMTGSFLALIFGRLAFAWTDWGLFSADWTRLFFFIKYPGLSFAGVLVGGGLGAALSAAVLGLDWLLIMDFLAVGLTFGSVAGYLGCFADRCVEAPLSVLGLLPVLFLVFSGLTVGLLRVLQRTVGLADLARKPGLFLLCYLIFQLVSTLILEIARGWGKEGLYYVLALFGVGAVLGTRYRKLFIYVSHEVSQRGIGTNFKLFGKKAQGAGGETKET